MRESSRGKIEFTNTPSVLGDIDPRASNHHSHRTRSQGSELGRGPRKTILERDLKLMWYVPRFEAGQSRRLRHSGEVGESHKRETTGRV